MWQNLCYVEFLITSNLTAGIRRIMASALTSLLYTYGVANIDDGRAIAHRNVIPLS